MAAVTAAVAVGAGMAYAANRQGAAAKKAANAQGNAAQQAMQKYTDLYDQSRSDATPWLETGQQANSRLQALMNGDMSSFLVDPGYQFRMDQGIQGLDRSAAARGRLFSGGHSTDLLNYNQGLASQEYGNFYNRLMGLSNQGLGTAQYLGGLARNYGNQYGQALGLKGQADAQRAAAGPMTQAGYGNALASAFSTYAGMGGGGGGGFGGGSGLSSLFGGNNAGAQRASSYSTLMGNQAGTGQGSIYNFGNNVDNLWGWKG